jgi:ABC-type cobalamin/Fe3+-siderophores transport system ATPase subunit
MQFGAKPLFENVSVKFGAGNRYGLIGANGCGKSTFMKILGGDLEPSGGQVMLEPNVRLGKLRQDQFAYEEFTVIDTVIMGHEELWKVKAERDRIYSLPEMTEEDGMAVAELETEFAEMDGYTAESRAGELLLGLGIGIEQHFGPMSEVSPGWKLRVLLAQALFSDPEVLLLDEPTNHLDINTIRWLENVLTQRSSLMIIILHDRGDPVPRATAVGQRQEESADLGTAIVRQPLLGQRLESQAGNFPRQADRQDPAGRSQTFEPCQPVHSFRADQKAAPSGGHRRAHGQRLRRQDPVQGLQLHR